MKSVFVVLEDPGYMEDFCIVGIFSSFPKAISIAHRMNEDMPWASRKIVKVRKWDVDVVIEWPFS